jgi:hypothetical protein
MSEFDILKIKKPKPELPEDVYEILYKKSEMYRKLVAKFELEVET